MVGNCTGSSVWASVPAGMGINEYVDLSATRADMSRDDILERFGRELKEHWDTAQLTHALAANQRLRAAIDAVAHKLNSEECKELYYAAMGVNP